MSGEARALYINKIDNKCVRVHVCVFVYVCEGGIHYIRIIVIRTDQLNSSTRGRLATYNTNDNNTIQYNNVNSIVVCVCVDLFTHLEKKN